MGEFEGGDNKAGTKIWMVQLNYACLTQGKEIKKFLSLISNNPVHCYKQENFNY